jgi:hypothetical protein
MPLSPLASKEFLPSVDQLLSTGCSITLTKFLNGFQEMASTSSLLCL